MKRAVVKQPAAVAPAMIVKTTKPCTRTGCEKFLNKSQRKFCSHYCRNEVMRLEKGLPGGEVTYFQTKYKPEFATTVFKAFLEWCKSGHEPTLIPTESSYIVIHNAQCPTNELYAEYLEEEGHVDGLKVDTLSDWAAVHPRMAHAMERIKRIQRSFLLNNGLSGRYNSVISKLALGVNHGMVEKKDIDHTHKMIGVVRHVYDQANKLQEGHGE